MKALKKYILENGKSDEDFLEIFKELVQRNKYKYGDDKKCFNVFEESNLQKSLPIRFTNSDYKNFNTEKSEYLEICQEDDYYYNINEIYKIPVEIDHHEQNKSI